MTMATAMTMTMILLRGEQQPTRMTTVTVMTMVLARTLLRREQMILVMIVTIKAIPPRL